MQKKLKPSLREKKRYLLIKDSDKTQVEKAILEFIGILGYGKAGIKFIKSHKITKNPDKDIIIAVNRKETDKVRASLALKNIMVAGVSGTLKGLGKKKK